VATGADILTLNVGGERVVQRRRSTLCALKGSFLASRFSGASERGLGWRYRGDDDFALSVRTAPSLTGEKTGNTLAPGDAFQVAEEQRGPDGILYLKLADGRGWVFERKPGVGVMCERVKEQDLDREGRHFVNYSPTIFLPLLDYLGMKELEVKGHPVPPPKAPEHMRDEFDAMLRDFGILPSMGIGERRLLLAMAMPYSAVPWWAYGLAFEVRTKRRPILLTALETCGVTREGDEVSEGGSPTATAPAPPPVPCTLHVAEGPLRERLGQRSAWIEVGRGTLAHRTGSRIVLANSIMIKPAVATCLYIATAVPAGDLGRSGVAFGAPTPAGVSAEDGDVTVMTGHFSTRFDDFSDGGWYPFIGKIEYTLPLSHE